MRRLEPHLATFEGGKFQVLVLVLVLVLVPGSGSGSGSSSFQVYGHTNHHNFCAKSTRKTLF